MSILEAWFFPSECEMRLSSAKLVLVSKLSVNFNGTAFNLLKYDLWGTAISINELSENFSIA